MNATEGRPGTGKVTSSVLPFSARKIRQVTHCIEDGRDSPATVVRLVRESRENMHDFWYAWAKLLEVSFDKFDWSQPIRMDRGKFEQFADAADFYRREIEPFFGPIDRLREMAIRYRKGELTHEEGVRQLRKIDRAYSVAVEHPEMSVRQVAGEAGVSIGTAFGAGVFKKNYTVPKKLNTIADEAAASGLSPGHIYRQRRLKADHPELWAEVEAGTKSTRQAAVAAGIVKVPSVLTQLRKLWAKASDEERRAFIADITHTQEAP